MGQRLVISAKLNDEVIFALYQHWSGYTSSSIEATNSILNKVMEFNDLNDRDRILFLERYHVKSNSNKRLDLNDKEQAKLFWQTYLAQVCVEEFQANFTDEEKDAYRKIDVNGVARLSFESSRDSGLMSITPKDISNSLGYAEALVELNLESQTVDFDAIFYCHIDEYIERHVSVRDESGEFIPVLDRQVEVDGEQMSVYQMLTEVEEISTFDELAEFIAENSDYMTEHNIRDGFNLSDIHSIPFHDFYCYTQGEFSDQVYFVNGAMIEPIE